MMVQAVDFLHPLKKTKSLSPTASSTTSSHSPKYEGSKCYSPSAVAKVEITVAPVSLAILFKSPLSTLRSPIHPASTRYFEARSSMPILVRITFAPASRIFFTLCLRTSHSFCLIFYKFLGSSTRTWMPIWSLNLFRLKSKHAIFAFFISVGICWWAFTVCSAYPFTSWLSVELCPWAFKIFIDFIGYFAPKILSCFIALIESTTKLEKNSGSALMSLLDMEVFAQFLKASSPRLSTEMANSSSMYRHASRAAILNPEIMFVGWTFIFISSLALFRS